jgi:hypothetical protein
MYIPPLGVRNLMKKEAEKILEYEDLTKEIECLWNVKTNLMPLKTGADRIIPK